MKKLLLSIVLTAVAAPALAHTGQGDAAGFWHGLLHPVLGADHLLAMLAVGLWSGFAGPRRLWAGAAIFLAAMAVGAALGWVGVGLPQVEAVILASVLALGGLVLLARPGQGPGATVLSLAAIAGFAACHGQAHAAEAQGSIAPYLAGFLTATAALHLIGIGLARLVVQARAARLWQGLIGSGIALSGLYMMAGWP